MEAPEFTLFASPDRCHSLTASSGNVGDHFVVEDLLNFPPDDADGALDNVTGSSTDSSTVTAIDSGNSSVWGGPSSRETCFDGGFPDSQFSADICVPYDDMAELEWLSNFVEESFSTDDHQNLHLISGMSSRTADEASGTAPDDSHPSLGCGDDGCGGTSMMFHSEMTVPAKARSKRSRAATCNWASRLLVLSSEDSSPEEAAVNVHVEEPQAPLPLLVPPQQAAVVVPGGGKKTARSTTPKKKHSAEGAVPGREARRCLHCATDTTPQWRTGPMGPKTLCNACGVRYKSGRLVPEYRPAASPTFMLTKHSNSHRKVLELRRLKEMTRAAQQQQQQIQLPHHHQQQQPRSLPDVQNDMVLDTESEDGYLIHQHVCPDFWHPI
ncbi:hypothetical protein MLD38_014075 [Melastoma candidum]|uniref:Uncharacterized protein n=1 Tax=Melastoma candidum TaxID=119954 RepID=A0ACB9RF99_9MYRT|nr:hypothetical protein MLD38_014075 [Melastoma candidum]